MASSTSIANLVLAIHARNYTQAALGGVSRGLATVRTDAALAATALAGGVAAGTIGAIKGAADFQRTMVQTAALTGQTAAQVGASNQQMAQGFAGTSKQVLAAVGATGQSAQQLGEALYFIASSGFTRAADAQKLMTLSGKDATIGHVDARVAADALTTSLNAYGASAQQAGRYNDILLQGVNLGKAEFGDFARSLGNVLPLAAQAGISFRDVTAALSTLTLSGLSPRRSAMDLNRLIQSIIAPTKGQQGMAAALGIDFSKVNLSTPQGLLTFLEQVRAKVAGLPKGEQAEVFKKLFGNQAAILGAQVLSNNIGNLQHNIDVMNRTVGNGAVTNRAYAAVGGTLAVQFQTLRNRVGAAAIQLGGVLSPVALRLVHIAGALLPGALRTLTDLIRGIEHPTAGWRAAMMLAATVATGLWHTLAAVGRAVGDLAGGIGRLLPHVQAGHAALGQARTAAAGFGGALGLLVPLVAAYIGVTRTVRLATDAWKAAQIALDVAMSINPIVAVAIAIGALVLAVVYAWNHWRGFHAFVVGAWQWLAGVFGPGLGWLGGILRGAFSAAWGAARAAADRVWDAVRVVWQLFKDNVLPILGQVGDTLKGAFAEAWQTAQRAARAVWDTIKAFWDWLSTTLHLEQVGQGIKDALGGAFDFVKKKIEDFLGAFQNALKLLEKLPGMGWIKAALQAVHHAKHEVDAHDAATRRATHHHTAVQHHHAAVHHVTHHVVHHASSHAVHHHAAAAPPGLTPAQRRHVEAAIRPTGGPAGRTPAQQAALDFQTAMGYFRGQKGLDPSDVKRMQADIAAMLAADPQRAARLQQQLDVALAHRRDAIRHQGAVAAHHQRIVAHHRQVVAQRAAHHAQVVTHHNQVVAHHAAVRAAHADAATLLRAIHNEIREHRFAQAARDITRFRGLETTALRAAGLDPTRAAREAGVITRGLQDDLARAERGRPARPVALQDAVDRFKTDLLQLGTSARDHARLVADAARIRADEVAAHVRGARVALDFAENMKKVDDHFRVAAAARQPVAPVPRYGALAGETGYGQTTVSFGGAQQSPWQAVVAALREQIAHLRAQLAKDDQVIALLEGGNATGSAQLGVLRSIDGHVIPGPPQPQRSAHSALKAAGSYAPVTR